jgi:hypothetical protein
VNPEIKPMPCPFCGSDDIHSGSSYVTCQECEADGPISHIRRHVEKWNHREPLANDIDAAPDFVSQFRVIQSNAHAVNCRNGWWDDRNTIMESGIPGVVPLVVIGCLGLSGTEISEAIEAVRKHDPKTWGDAKTKDTLVRELAGNIVRNMDLAERLDLPLAEAIVEEIKANAERGFRHGGKAA